MVASNGDSTSRSLDTLGQKEGRRRAVTVENRYTRTAAAYTAISLA